MIRLLVVTFVILSWGIQSVSANLDADTEILDANQHVIMFEKGVDSFLAGDYASCDDFWLPLARAGDPMAARNMALLYHRGLGVRQDLEEAELFYRMAADNGVTVAQTVLGTLLIKGDEFDRNLEDAMRYLTAASQAGDPVAAWNLGLLYENGIGIDKNLEKANILFQQAARGGYEPAMKHFTEDLQGTKTENHQEDVVNETIHTAIKEIVTDEKPENFDTRPKPAIPPKRTFEDTKKIDQEHDSTHYSDQIHFNEKLQQNDPDLIFRDDTGLHNKEQIGIYRDLNPFNVLKSKKNRLGGRFETDQLGDNPLLIKADEAYHKKEYETARQIWEQLLEESFSDEAAYRLGRMYSTGTGVTKDLFKAYAYWKKGADSGGKKSLDQLESFRAQLSDQELLEYEKTLIQNE